jgi:hypothetical protein
MAGILWAVIGILVLFWLIGLAMDIAGGLIHIALVVAAVLFLVNLFMGRTRV